MVTFSFSGSLIKPGARILTARGIKIITIAEKIARMKKRIEMAREAKKVDFSLPSSTILCESIGTKEVLKAPSAKRLLNKFGSLNDTKKASESIPAPRYLAMTTSRMNPAKRLMSVMLPKVAIDLNKDIFISEKE